MDANLKAKWIEALRSGKYKQAHRRLRDRDAYCCLGVLCEVAGLQIADGGDSVIGASENGNGYEPIYRLIGEAFEARRLAEANDGGDSFEAIARHIEARLR